ncbi:MAG: biotin--[acetyl-CoA-carboxylase] ligase [Desulfobacter sp.]|nr:biotin--[acetyl-CoA-carboxylase] ligase [Desulfobacter sp.]WDP85506.1 MAG: biotin--[acetyl-CoA-carboxylase] ligase [Desulfobacter sp.]
MKVNQKNNTQSKILELLFRAKGKTLSGVRISEKTGISRVGVWKHIKAMKLSGIPIESHFNGYVLTTPEDLLAPFCFEPDLRKTLFYYPEVKSTMDTAKTLARQGAAHHSCCVAEIQTRGRGRLNREWVSAKGGLWFTLILKPDLPPPMAYIYNFAASLSLSRTINRLSGLNTTVKWPNDLLLEGKKLTGILSEMETQADMIQFLVIGMGINVNNDVSKENFEATSLKQAMGRPVSRRLILSQFLIDFKALTQNVDVPKIMALWRERTSTIGTRVRVETLNQTLEGKAVGVDDQGGLTIETQDKGSLDEKSKGKKRETIIYGDCFHTAKDTTI